VVAVVVAVVVSGGSWGGGGAVVVGGWVGGGGGWWWCGIGGFDGRLADVTFRGHIRRGLSRNREAGWTYQEPDVGDGKVAGGQHR